MKILYYELRKEVIRKSFVLLFGICVVVNFFWLEWEYRSNVGFSEDFVKVKETEERIIYYKELHQLLDGKLDAQKVSYISEEYHRYNALINEDAYSTAYDETTHTGYVFGDYTLLTTHFYNPVEYLVRYKEQNDTFVEKAEDNIRFFREKDNTYEVEKNTFLVKHYKDRNPLFFYETSGWKHLFSYDKSDLFVLVLLFIGILPSFSKERYSGMEMIQKTSVVGSRFYIPVKIMAHICMAVLLELVFSICNFGMIHMQYGLEGSNMMLYSISKYQYTPFAVSVLDFYFIIVFAKCLGFSIIAILMTFLARIIKNTYSLFLVVLGMTTMLLYVSGFDSGITIGEKILTLLSPFSLLKIGELAVSFREIKIFGHFFSFYPCLFGVQMALTMTILFIFYLIEKQKECDLMILSEVYKVFIKQRLIFFFLVLLFFACVYRIVIGYDTTAVIQSSESYYRSFFETYEGKITEEKMEQIKTEYRKIETDATDTLASKQKKQAFESFYHVYLYEADGGSGYLTDTRGWETLLCHNEINYLEVIFIVLLGVMLFSVEYENEMHVMIVSACGRHKVIGSKIFIGIVGSVIASVLFWFVTIFYLMATVGLKNGNYPLQTIEFFEHSAYETTLGQALVFSFALHILGSILLVSFVMFLAVLLKKKEISMVLSLLSVMLPKMIFSKGSVIYKIPLAVSLLSANGFLWSDRYSYDLIEKQEVIVFQAIEKEELLVILAIDMLFIILFLMVVFLRFSNCGILKKKKRKTVICTGILLVFCLTGCGRMVDSEEVIIDGSLNGQVSQSRDNAIYYIDQNENAIYREDEQKNITAITRHVFPSSGTITNLFVSEKTCYYLLECDTNTEITVYAVDLESFEEKLVYSSGGSNTEDFYGLKENTSDAEESLKNLATVKWFFVTDKFIYYQKESTIYRCSLVNGRESIIDTYVSDGEVRYQNGVLYYRNAYDKEITYKD